MSGTTGSFIIVAVLDGILSRAAWATGLLGKLPDDPWTNTGFVATGGHFTADDDAATCLGD